MGESNNNAVMKQKKTPLKFFIVGTKYHTEFFPQAKIV